ncbi:MAG: glycosyltransferase family 4 protein [Acidobacteriota bacterium]|nr:MAG: glycosyltransferase family 4 protein [Acidobacteriota bacterium]
MHLLASGYAHLACQALAGTVLLPSVRGTVVWPHWIKRRVYRSMFRRARRTLVNSRAGARYVVERFGAPEQRLVVVPNGIDIEALQRLAEPALLSERLELEPGTPLIGLIGKDAPVKNIPRFVEIVRRLSASVPELHAVLIGHGLDEPARDRLAPDLPARRVHFLGPRAEAAALVSGLDALVLTSDSEGCPNVVLEALAVGTPVVSADVGDVAQMIDHGRTGHIVPAADIDAFVQALVAVLSDLERYRERVRAERGRLSDAFSIEAMVSRTIGIWDELLA